MNLQSDSILRLSLRGVTRCPGEPVNRAVVENFDWTICLLDVNDQQLQYQGNPISRSQLLTPHNSLIYTSAIMVRVDNLTFVAFWKTLTTAAGWILTVVSAT